MQTNGPWARLMLESNKQKDAAEPFKQTGLCLHFTNSVKYSRWGGSWWIYLPSVHLRHEVMWCCDAVRQPRSDWDESWRRFCSSVNLCGSYLNCNSRFIILFLFYIQFIFSDSTFNIFLPFVLINIFVFSFLHLKWQTVIGNQIFKLSKLSWSLSARL